MNQTQSHLTSEDRTLQIVDHGEQLTLSYTGLEAFHKGDSWWGCAVGFRAMQVAATSLSGDHCWDRKQLYVVSAHPGPGVLDAIEFVTGCIGQKRFRHLRDNSGMGCNPDMKFEWWVCDGETTAHINLRPDFVPASFFERLARLGTEQEREKDRIEFDAEKQCLSDSLWNDALNASFHSEHTPPLKFGEAPDA